MRSALTARAVTWSSAPFSFDSSARARTTSTLARLELGGLAFEPRDPTLHRLDERERDIRSHDGEHEAGKSCAGADITDAAGTQERSDQGAVQDVSGPQAGELERPDETQFLAVARERLGELTALLEVRPEDLGGRGGLGFESVGHRFT